ncbi:hypothetical protein KUTeg_004359 [Tegillarca granosa]|uniref:PKD/REJ-like domain-containing protein n=1 Tax=Tegillarca granosa TaxID=220873 RepID=A0ABQ9FPT5_TEGGR|nr:hypothetical protein KUTeg_004359 [Tegillarca granosa]
MINQTSGTLTVNTGEMYENDKIELKLIARKGDRQGEAVQILEIVEGEPPEIGLICVTNCGFKMNPDSRYTLKSKVEGWVKGTYFYYRWKLYGGKDWISLTEIPVDKWENNTSTGSEGPHMALDPILDDLLDVYKFSLYFFSVKIWRWGTSENLAGVTAQSFRTNEKPIPGLCSIFPKTGYGYETKYYIKAESFIDNDDGNLFTYKFGFWRSASDPITWFYEGRFSDNKGYEAPIPEGYEQENYRVNIVCRAYDLGGSFADAYTDFTIIENATSSSGEINSLLVAADSKVGSVANCLAKFLNEEAEEMASTTIETTTMSMENTTYVNSTLSSDAVAAALARRIEIREFIIVGMLRIKTPNIEILQGMAAALGTLSRHHNELSLTAQCEQLDKYSQCKQLDKYSQCKQLDKYSQESGAQILISYCECFKTETQISANDREEAALTVVEFIGNTLHACGYAAEQSERDANALYEEYYSSTLGDSDATTTTTTQATVQTTLTPEQYKAKQDEILAAKDRAKRACTAIQNAMDACIDVISKYKVAGERAAVLPTPKANLTSVKGLTQDLNKNLMQVLGSAEAAEKNTASGILLVKSQSVLGAPGHEITMEAEMLMNRFPYNYHTWTNSTEKASTKITSDVVTLKFRDSNNQEVPVKNNAQEFDIFVDRTNYDTTLTSVCNATTDWGEKMVIHTVRIEPGNSLNIALNPISQMSEIKNYLKNMNTWNGTDSELRANMFEVGEVDLYVFVGLGETVPTEEVYNFTCHLPLSDKKLDAMMSYLDSLSYENDTSQPRSVYLNERPDRYTCFFSNDQLNLEKSTNAHIGIKHRVLDGNRTTVTESSLTSTTPLPTTTTTAASGT